MIKLALLYCVKIVAFDRLHVFPKWSITDSTWYLISKPLQLFARMQSLTVNDFHTFWCKQQVGQPENDRFGTSTLMIDHIVWWAHKPLTSAQSNDAILAKTCALKTCFLALYVSHESELFVYNLKINNSFGVPIARLITFFWTKCIGLL